MDSRISTILILLIGYLAPLIEACGSTLETATRIGLPFRNQMAIIHYVPTHADRTTVTCYWSVQVPNGRKVGWRFDEDFNTPSNKTTCGTTQDYLEMFTCNCHQNDNQVHQRIGMWCRETPPTPGVTPDSDLLIKVVTHGQNENRGFKVAVQEGKVPSFVPSDMTRSHYFSVGSMIVAACLGNAVFIALICCYLIRRGRSAGTGWIRKFRHRNDPPAYSAEYSGPPRPRDEENGPPAYEPPAEGEKPPPYMAADNPPPYDVAQHI